MTTLAACADWPVDRIYRQPPSGVASTDPDVRTGLFPFFQWTEPRAALRPVPMKCSVPPMEEHGCRLRVQIAATIEWENGCFYAENESLGHYGVGDTAELAVRDMFRSMCVVYAAYLDSPEESLDAGAKELLSMHDRVLERVP